MTRVSENLLRQITSLAKEGATSVNCYNSRLTNVGSPIGAGDIATKGYVDANGGGGGTGSAPSFELGPYGSTSVLSSLTEIIKRTPVQLGIADGYSAELKIRFYGYSDSGLSIVRNCEFSLSNVDGYISIPGFGTNVDINQGTIETTNGWSTSIQNDGYNIVLYGLSPIANSSWRANIWVTSLSPLSDVGSADSEPEVTLTLENPAATINVAAIWLLSNSIENVYVSESGTYTPTWIIPPSTITADGYGSRVFYYWGRTNNGIVTDRKETSTIVTEPSSTITFTVTGSTFSPQIVTSSGTATWTVVETAATATGLTPTFNFGSSATRHVELTMSTALSDVTVINVGHVNLFDQGRYSIGGEYDRAQQNVAAIAGLDAATGLTILAAYQNPITTLDLSNCTALQFIECGNCSSLTSISLPAATGFVRLCLEACNITSLNLTPVAPYIYDLRAAVQTGGALQITHGGTTFNNLYHWCTRDQTLTFATAFNWATQVPVLEEAWVWNDGLTTEFNPSSTSLTSVRIYGNEWSSVSLPICANINVIEATNCALLEGEVDSLIHDGYLSVMAHGITDLEMILTGTNSGPSYDGYLEAQAMRALGNTITTNTPSEVPGVGVDVDEFAGAAGAPGNGWYSGLNDAVAVLTGTGQLQRTDAAGNYRVYVNPGNVVTMSADYDYTLVIKASTMAQANVYVGGVIRWSGGTGVRLLWADPLTLTVGDASGFNTNNVALTTVNALPASWTGGSSDRTLRVTAVGSAISIYCDGTLCYTCTVATNATQTGTSYGICGDNYDGNVHQFERIAVAAI